jgi:competence protein ComEC
MRVSIGFLIGTLLLLSLKTEPNVYLVIFGLLSCSIIYWVFPKFRHHFSVFLAIVFGFLWSWVFVLFELKHRLPDYLESKTIMTEGLIVSIPEHRAKSIRFIFSFNLIDPPFSQTIKALIVWYHPENIKLHVGQRWQFALRLKRPHNLWNPGGFDYQTWLMQQHIHATGYVVSKIPYQYLGRNYFPIESLREKISSGMYQILGDDYIGLLSALTTGQRDRITPEQWSVMRHTGTNHLFAIAGLHLGFIATLIYGLIRIIWRCIPSLALYLPLPQAQACFALFSTVFYSALAGFSLPTQRALIMCCVFLLFVLARRNKNPWQAWRLALLAVVAYNPLCVLSESFWLSFVCVAYIIYGVSGRSIGINKFWQGIRIQWIVTLGLMPISLLFFHQISLTAIVANLIAIPWVGFVVLPLSLLGSLVQLIHIDLGKIILIAAQHTLAWIWYLLTCLASVPWLQWYYYYSNVTVTMIASSALFLLLMPQGFPARWLGLIWLLPAITVQPVHPKFGEIWFTLLDIGQGLASVIQTANHNLIYDTGLPSDPTRSPLVSFLQQQGIKQVDALIVSHADQDHSGGACNILQNISVKHLLTSFAPERSLLKFCFTKAKHHNLCQLGQRWTWDGVQFEVLHPSGSIFSGNNNSCVLKIDNGHSRILLPGDIEKPAEYYLIEKARDHLASTILVAPHHGSKTSSTQDFIDTVNPRYVLFSIGYLNRFHFPNARVVQRYQDQAAIVYDSVHDGAITFKLKGRHISISRYRKENERFWQK